MSLLCWEAPIIHPVLTCDVTPMRFPRPDITGIEQAMDRNFVHRREARKDVSAGGAKSFIRMGH